MSESLWVVGLAKMRPRKRGEQPSDTPLNESIEGDEIDDVRPWA